MANRVLNYAILTSGDMSQSSLVSSWVLLNEVNLLSFQCVYTGSPVGTIKIQGSDDESVNASTVGNDVDGSSVAISGAGRTMYNIADVGYIWARVVYTKDSGTGSLTVKVAAKGIN